MAAGAGFTDTDMGLNDIRKNILEVSKLAVKVGIVKGSGDVDGVSVAQYAAWNEMGVKGPPFSVGPWFIPPRPFIRGWLTEKDANIKAYVERTYKAVTGGTMDAQEAIGKLGTYGRDGIKSYIRTASFTPNAERTIKRKKSSKPLIDTGTMRNSVRYEIIKKGDPVDGPVIK